MGYITKLLLFSAKILLIGSILALSSSLAFAGCTSSMGGSRNTFMLDVEVNATSVGKPPLEKTTNFQIICTPDRTNDEIGYTQYLEVVFIKNAPINVRVKEALSAAQGYWNQEYPVSVPPALTALFTENLKGKGVITGDSTPILDPPIGRYVRKNIFQQVTPGTRQLSEHYYKFKNINDRIVMNLTLEFTGVRVNTNQSVPLPATNLVNGDIVVINLNNNDPELNAFDPLTMPHAYQLDYQVNTTGDARYMKCYGSTVSVTVNPDPIDFGDVKQSQLKSGGVKKPFSITVTKNDTENSCTESFYPRIAFIAPNSRLALPNTYDMENGTFLRILDSSGKPIIFTEPGNITTGHFYFNQDAQFTPSVQSSTSTTKFTAELKENPNLQLNPGEFEATIPLLIQYY